MSSILYVVGVCSSCGTGPLGIRVCGSCHTSVVMCEECDAVWPQPGLDGAATFLDQPELPCPSCSQSLLHAPAHWACFDEIEAAGWQAKILQVGLPMADIQHDDS